MQFSTLTFLTAAFAALTVAVPTFEELEERAAAANPTVNLYSDTACTKLATTVNLGSPDSGCITYSPGFLSARLAANPRSNLAAYIFTQNNCGGNATDYAIFVNKTCNDVSAGGIARSFIHN